MSLGTPPDPGPRRHLGVKLGLLGAGVAAGAILATAYGASAQGISSSPTSGSGSASATTVPAAPSGAPHGAPGGAPHGMPGGAPHGRPGPMPAGPGGARPVRSDEKPVSGARAATLKAAALKAVPGGTVIRIETDAGDGAYEAHMRKADGSPVTVKFDKTLAVTKVESGMGQGDPAPTGH